MLHGPETEYNSEMAIERDGSNFGKNNGTTDLIEMSRDLYHKKVASVCPRNLVGRFGHEILGTVPLTTRQ